MKIFCKLKLKNMENIKIHLTLGYIVSSSDLEKYVDFTLKGRKISLSEIQEPILKALEQIDCEIEKRPHCGQSNEEYDISILEVKCRNTYFFMFTNKGMESIFDFKKLVVSRTGNFETWEDAILDIKKQ